MRVGFAGLGDLGFGDRDAIAEPRRRSRRVEQIAGSRGCPCRGRRAVRRGKPRPPATECDVLLLCLTDDASSAAQAVLLAPDAWPTRRPMRRLVVAFIAYSPADARAGRAAGVQRRRFSRCSRVWRRGGGAFGQPGDDDGGDPDIWRASTRC